MSDWITDWSDLDDGTNYLVCPINARADNSLYLGQPVGIQRGWQVKCLMLRCYAALELSPYPGAIQTLRLEDSLAQAKKLLTAAAHALRSYQYGNHSPDLAAEIAGAIDAFLEGHE